MKEVQVSSEKIFNGKIFDVRRDVVRLTNGAETIRDIVEHPGGVGVLAIDAEENIILVSQYRYPFSRICLEIPAGKLEYAEDPKACGIRELEEETGYVAKNFTLLSKLIPTPAYLTEVIHIYYATDLVKTSQNLDPDEFLSVFWVPFNKALEMVMSGEIIDSKTQIAILKYAISRLN